MPGNEDPVARIVLKIVEGRENLRVDGLENIHPMYEALIALLKRNLGDDEVVRRFAKDENSLKDVLVTESFLANLTSSNANEIRRLFNSGASLKDITERAALYISEGKRTQGGRALYQLSRQSGSDSLKKVLGKANLGNVYVEYSEIQELKGKAETRKKVLKYSGIAAGVLTAAMAVAGYFGYNKISSMIKENAAMLMSPRNKISELEKQLNSENEKIGAKKKELESIERDLTKKISEKSNQEALYFEYKQKTNLENSELIKVNRQIREAGDELIKTNTELRKKRLALDEARQSGHVFAQNYKVIGAAYVNLGKNEEAKKYLEKVIEFNPDDPEANNLFAVIHLNDKEPDKAKKYLDRAIQIVSNEPSYYHNLAVYHIMKGDVEEAIKTYQTSIAEVPNNADNYYRLGNLRYETGDRERAVGCFKKFLDLDTSRDERTIEVRKKLINIQEKFPYPLEDLVKPDIKSEKQKL